ncbi:MAG TPA: hypothetical protein VGQ83_24925 [Polyangia bacterium]|jgi:hypothetical protein
MGTGQRTSRVPPPRAKQPRAAATPPPAPAPVDQPRRAFLELRPVADPAAPERGLSVTAALSFDLGHGRLAAFWVAPGKLESILPDDWRPARPPGALSPAGQLLWLVHRYCLDPACRAWHVGEGVLEHLDRVLPAAEGQKAFVQETVLQLATGSRRAKPL